MALGRGTRLGAYEILTLIGSGGMGEVYRARDTKLQRDVAIKVLPASVAADAESLSRLRREALLLASLNHPHIAAIYGVEDADPVALILELIEGPTIADRLERGPVPWNEAVHIAVQIAQGLEAAHEHGVIHRDLKPANVKLTSNGGAKVLDFGLAKIARRDALNFAGEHETTAPTIAPDHLTRAGMLVGTIAYMSPEQARGQTIDKRADIWAFGCVLFEMLSGRSPFAGPTPTDTLAAVVERDPPWSVVPAGTPPIVVDVLRRCLVKDRDRRVHDLADVRLPLEDVLSAPPPAPAATRHSARVPIALAIVAGIVVMAAAILTLYRMFGATQSAASLSTARVVRFTIGPDQLVDEQTCGSFNCGETVLALSPDSHEIVFAARSQGVVQLFLRRLDQFIGDAIRGTEGALGPVFSPDGRAIAFIADRKLKTVALAGGTPAVLVDAVEGRGLCWAADGNIYYNAGVATGIWRIPAGGGTPSAVTSIGAEFQDRFPDVLPDASAILFSGSSRIGEERIFVQSMRTGERREIATGFAPHYLASGYLVYVQSGRLMAVRFDPVRLEARGVPTAIIDGVEQTTWDTPQFAVSRSGTLAYIPATAQPDGNELVWASLDGKVESTINASGRAYVWPRISPDGRTIAASIRGIPTDVWQYDIARETWSRFTFDGGSEFPVWSPDGRTVIYSTGKTGPTEIAAKLFDNTSAETTLLKGDQIVPFSVFPDGKTLLYVQVDPKTLPDIWTLDLDHPDRRSPFLHTPFREGGPAVSPDGHWIAYASDESGRSEVYARPFPGPGQKWTISTDGGTEPMWPRQSQEIFYRNGDKMMVVDVKTSPEFSASRPRPLFERSYERSDAYWPNYDVTADGKRLLMLRTSERQSRPARQIAVVLNWVNELEQRLP